MAVVRIALSGARARKVRLVLTSLAILLGVSFVAGSFIFTDSITKSFDTLFAATAKGIDVKVRDKQANPAKDQAGGPRDVTKADPNLKRVPGSLVDQLRAVPGVHIADGLVQGTAQVIGKHHKLVGGNGPPTLGFNWSQHANLASTTVAHGRAPQRSGEMGLDISAASKGGYKLGDTVLVAFDGGRAQQSFTLVGTMKFGRDNALQGATLAYFDTKTAQRVFQAGDRYDEIEIQADKGVSATTLRDRIARTLSGRYEAITGAQSTKEQLKQIGTFINFLKYGMLGFAAISLFVAAFIIFITFSITVAQRQVELGLLRAVGAARRQIVGLVLVESFVVGLLTSVVGIAAGIGVAYGVRALLNALGFDMPTGTLTVQARTIVVALLVGTVITLIASIVPALRASRVSPIEAMRGEVHTSTGRWRRIVSIGFGLLSLVAGAAMGAAGIFVHPGGAQGTLTLLGAGFVVLIVGVAMMGHVAVRPLVAVLGIPLRRRLPGQLAIKNATRNPRRTITTATALMIGLGIASFAAIFASSAQYSFGKQIDRALGPDLTIMNQSRSNGSASYLPPQVAQKVGHVDGVAFALGQRFNRASINGKGKDHDLLAVSGDRITDALKLTTTSGSLDGFSGSDSVAVSKKLAKSDGLAVGQRIKVKFSPTATRTLRVAAIYDDTGLSDMIVPIDVFDAVYPKAVQYDAMVVVGLQHGANAKQVRRNIDQAVKDVPYAKVQSAAELKQQAQTQLGQLLGLIFGLLALSIIIALFGIVNTLALSVFERTREIGLLRAVGMSRRQVRSMIRGESILVSLIGAILGLALGIGLGWAGVGALKDQGFQLQIPVTLVATLLVLSILAGIVAAILPARRAARLDVLQAIATE